MVGTTRALSSWCSSMYDTVLIELKDMITLKKMPGKGCHVHTPGLDGQNFSLGWEYFLKNK